MSNSRDVGNRRVKIVLFALAEHGFRCTRSSSSGARKGDDMKAVLLACDIVAIPLDTCLPNLLVEVGGEGKRIGVSFAELSEHPLPRTIPLIVRHVGHARWRWHLDCDTSFDSLPELIMYLREHSYTGLDRLAAENRLIAVGSGRSASARRKRLPSAAAPARRPVRSAARRAGEGGHA